MIYRTRELFGFFTTPPNKLASPIEKSNTLTTQNPRALIARAPGDDANTILYRRVGYQYQVTAAARPG